MDKDFFMEVVTIYLSNIAHKPTDILFTHPYKFCAIILI